MLTFFVTLGDASSVVLADLSLFIEPEAVAGVETLSDMVIFFLRLKEEGKVSRSVGEKGGKHRRRVFKLEERG